MSRKKRSLWLIIILIVILFLITEIFLPGLAEDRLKKILDKRADKIENLDIKVASFPALKILLGRIDHVSVNIEGLVVDELYINHMNINYHDLIFSKTGFSGINTRLEAMVTEKSLNDYIDSKYPDLENFNVTINPEQVLMEGAIKLFEARINLKLAGNFVINDKEEIYFVPADFQLENIKIPIDLLKRYLEGLNFSFDLKELEIPLSIDELRLGSGRMIITGND